LASIIWLFDSEMRTSIVWMFDSKMRKRVAFSPMGQAMFKAKLQTKKFLSTAST
jgi:hypothetical protein